MKKLNLSHMLDASQPLIMLESPTPVGIELLEGLDEEMYGICFTDSAATCVELAGLPSQWKDGLQEMGGAVAHPVARGGDPSEPLDSYFTVPAGAYGLIEVLEFIAGEQSRQQIAAAAASDYDPNNPPKSTPCLLVINRADSPFVLGNDRAVEKIRGFMEHALAADVYIVMVVSPGTRIPACLEDLVAWLHYDLPADSDYLEMLDGISARDSVPEGLDVDEVMQKAVEACRGLPIKTAETASSIVMASSDKLDPHMLFHQKAEHLKSSSGLDVWTPPEGELSQWNLDRIIGLSALKKYLITGTREGLQENVKLKHVLMLGVPGTGKSLAMQCAAGQLGKPLCSISSSAMMNKYVGESERQLASMLKAASSIEGILGIDEFARFLPGTGPDTTGGTEDRLLGALLQWFNDQRKVLVMSATNSMAALPPEITRSGRVDVVFFMGFPGEAAKAACWDMYRKEYNIEDTEIPPDSHWTPADIAQCCKNAQLLDCSLTEGARAVVPSFERYNEEITKLSAWAAKAGCIDAETGHRFTGLELKASSSAAKRTVKKRVQKKRAVRTSGTRKPEENN